MAQTVLLAGWVHRAQIHEEHFPHDKFQLERNGLSTSLWQTVPVTQGFKKGGVRSQLPSPNDGVPSIVILCRYHQLYVQLPKPLLTKLGQHLLRRMKDLPQRCVLTG